MIDRRGQVDRDLLAVDLGRQRAGAGLEQHAVARKPFPPGETRSAAAAVAAKSVAAVRVVITDLDPSGSGARLDQQDTVRTD